MKVILTEKVSSLGNVGEVVNVSQGYARNFLIPNAFAVQADEGNQKRLDDQKRRLSKRVDEERAVATELKSKMDGMVLEFVKKVGASGKLFGTVTNNELAKELAKHDFNIERRMISVSAPIKQLGSFDIRVKLFTDVEANIQAKVIMDPKQMEELKAKELALKNKAEVKGDSEEKTEEKKADEPKTEEEKRQEEVDKILR
ncbi:MAG: 50S ribosomal protein L9 [Bdellovibrionales bacterium]|jgi:large subunit ribosomal protein L9|nr:50S ribosomal protein L9 [Bdellovibrionales bacterium]